MPMQIAAGEKFACFAFARCGLDEGLPEELELRPQLWAATKLDLQVVGPWASWLGSITMDELQDSNLVIYTTTPSSQPDILDQENRDLAQALDYLFYGILLQGVPIYMKGFSVNGGNVGGKIDIRQFSELKRYEPSFEMPEFRPGEVALVRAATLASRVQTVNQGGPTNWARLRRGLRALFSGTRMQDGGDRLHQFVRTLEALLKPDIGSTRNQFVHRIDQTFTLANAETRDALLEIFDVRSYVEHVHLAIDALKGDEAARIATANRRTRQADALARVAMSRVLESDVLLNTFKSDAGIDGFWGLSDADRVAAWGERLDLRTIG